MSGRNERLRERERDEEKESWLERKMEGKGTVSIK